MTAAKVQLCRPAVSNSKGCKVQLCRPGDSGRAKYELVTSLRMHLGNQDAAFGCMGVGEDADGIKVSVAPAFKLSCSRPRSRRVQRYARDTLQKMLHPCTGWEVISRLLCWLSFELGG